MPRVRGAASARPVPARVIMLATMPAALPGPPMNTVSFPRLRAGETASQIFRIASMASLSFLMLPLTLITRPPCTIILSWLNKTPAQDHARCWAFPPRFSFDAQAAF